MVEDFVREFDGKCPVCGSENRISHRLNKDAIEAGKLNKEQSCLEVLIRELPSPVAGIIGITVPAEIEYNDKCDDCGNHFSWRIEKKQIPRPAGQPGRMPGQP